MITNDDIIIREMLEGDQGDVSRLVIDTFQNDPNSSSEGIKEFMVYAAPEAFMDRLTRNFIVLVAEVENRIIGMIELREKSHISMLFVERNIPRRGVGRLLLRDGLVLCIESNPMLARVTVNASPGTVDTYVQYGFAPVGSQQIKNGIDFVPMALVIRPELEPLRKKLSESPVLEELAEESVAEPETEEKLEAKPVDAESSEEGPAEEEPVNEEPAVVGGPEITPAEVTPAEEDTTPGQPG